ncbi:MAG TPA: MarR family transcriptional regulator [Cytophagaceae bacterium]
MKSLETEIKQERPFRDEYEKLLVNILYTSSWLMNINSQRLKPFGLTPQQYNVLRILRGRFPDSYSNQEITERMLDKSSNATRIADKLKEKKLIERKVNKDDRRAVDIQITEKGLNLLKAIEDSPDLLNKQFKNISKEKAKQMNEWLDCLRR